MLNRHPSATDAELRELIGFVQASLRASAAVFCWIDPGDRLEIGELRGVTDEFFREYLDGMHHYDPLDVYAIMRRDVRILRLTDECANSPADRNRIFTDYLRRHDIVDEVDFLFWQDGVPVAALGALKRHGDVPFDFASTQWDALHRFLEFTLGQHPRLRRRRRDLRLSRDHHLTPREIQVLDLLGVGAANESIADILRIGTATVKSHVVSILNKLGTDSRLGAVAISTTL